MYDFFNKSIKPYSCTFGYITLARWFCVSRKGGTGGGGWGHLQDAVHMVAARLGFEKAMVGNCTGRATPCPDCIDKLRKHYSHLAEGWFLTRKAANWALSRCMATNSADYCKLVMSGCGQSHETTYQCQKRTWVQSWSQSLDRNGEKVC